MEEPQPLPQILSPCSSGRRRSTDAKSPEFEFWMLRNPSFPQPNLLSADELFSDGVLLPLHLLQQPSNHDPPPLSPPPPPLEEDREKTPPPEQEPSNINIDCTLTPSKRWSYIFKRSDKKGLESDDSINTKEKKRDQKKNVGGGAASASGVGGAISSRVSVAELNINIWPFSRSRSAGNGGTRPRPAAAAAATRKVSSAPCSRSNSTGESKFRKWPPNSPSRAGVHLGRSSPVWKVRRGGGGGGSGSRKDINEGRRKPPAPSKARVLSLNVPMCIGYRHHLSCTSDENSAVSVAAAAGGGGETRIGGIVSGEVVRRSSLFNIRNLFTKKVC